MTSMTWDDVVCQLCDGLEKSDEDLVIIKKWLIEFAAANQLSIIEMNDLCWEDSTWIFDRIYG